MLAQVVIHLGNWLRNLALHAGLVRARGDDRTMSCFTVPDAALQVGLCSTGGQGMNARLRVQLAGRGALSATTACSSGWSVPHRHHLCKHRQCVGSAAALVPSSECRHQSRGDEGVHACAWSCP